MNRYKQVRVALIGAPGVGKSSLAAMLNREAINSSYVSTIGIDIRFIYVHDAKVKIILWDLAGQPRFSEITKSFINECDIPIYCYSADNERSYDEILDMYRLHKRKGYIRDKTVIVVATKIDSVRGTAYTLPGIDFEAKTGARFFATSAVTQAGRDEIFSYISDRVRPKPLSISRNERNSPWCGCVTS